MIDFIRALIRPYTAIVTITSVVGLGIFLVVKFADANMANQVLTFILATGATVVGFYFGERAAKKK